MRNSYVNIRRNGPDTSELDAGWDLEPESQPAHGRGLDSLRPSYASLRPSPAAQPGSATRSSSRSLLVAALSVSVAVAGVVVGLRAVWRTKAGVASTPVAVAARIPSGSARVESPHYEVGRGDSAVQAPTASSTAAQVAERGEPRQVLLEVEPPGATVFVHGRRIGSGLVTIELDEHQPEVATVRHPGYRARVVDIDGRADFLHIRLDALPRPRRVTRPLLPSVASAEPRAAVDAQPSTRPEGDSSTKSPSEADLAYPE